MVNVCMYFQVHQPFRMRHYSIFDIGSKEYFDEDKNAAVARKVADKCYLPANAALFELLEKHPEFKFAFSFSGVALEQFEKYCPEVIDSFKKLVATGRVEVLSETYHHSLSFLYSREEFATQVQLHANKVREIFGVTPKIFRNTELIYSNDIARYVAKLGYKGMLAEGWDPVLGWKSPNFIYTAKDTDMPVLLKNYRLSDDIAFRFSNKAWGEWPLTAEKFGNWASAVNGCGDCINLFMDYETLGEHQWESTGIFEFLKHMPGEILKHPDNAFKTPSELVAELPARDEFDCPHLLSWADMERDVSAWLGNKMQQSTLSLLYSLEKDVKATKDAELIDAWRKLTTSDHVYYMCTKWFSDGDVHKYFSPYETPYEAFMIMMNIIDDIKRRVQKDEIIADIKEV